MLDEKLGGVFGEILGELVKCVCVGKVVGRCYAQGNEFGKDGGEVLIMSILEGVYLTAALEICQLGCVDQIVEQHISSTKCQVVHHVMHL